MAYRKTNLVATIIVALARAWDRKFARLPGGVYGADRCSVSPDLSQKGPGCARRCREAKPIPEAVTVTTRFG